VDILVPRDQPNMTRLVRALSELPYGVAAELDPSQLLAKPITIVGDDPRVDVLTVAWTVRFEDAYPRRQRRRVEGVTLPYLSRADLIQSKRTGRPADQADIDVLSGSE
jgi:hypothetical protein